MKHFLRNCWLQRKTLFTIQYDSSDRPFTPRGPRIEGKLERKGYLRAWAWAQAWCIVHPRASVYLHKKTS